MNEKLVIIAQNCVKLHDQCVTNHFVTTVSGTGTDTLSFQLPFDPDAIWVFCTEPVVLAMNNVVAFFNADLGSLGYLCAVSQCAYGGFYYNMAMTNSSVFNRYSRAEDGTATLHNISGNGANGIFGQDLPYQIVAVKYADKTDKQRFTEMVERLTGSGTLKVWSSKVHAAFTDEEWAALIATKPDWTFEEV